MYSTYSDINFPFVYLDSSSILRSSDYAIELFTRKYALKHPQEFLEALEQLKKTSHKDNFYYQQIVLLQKYKKISKLITCETINDVILNNKMEQILLFGAIRDLRLDLDFLHQNYRTRKIVLWGESVDVKTYNQAALSIAQAKCVVVDPYFIKLSVGNSLINYISSTCKIILLGFERVDFPLNTNYIRLNTTPEELFTNLLGFLN